MPSPLSSTIRFRRFLFLILCPVFLFISLLTFAQVNLKYRILTGYLLSDDAPLSKNKPTLFVFEQAETFGQVFKLPGSPAPNARQTNPAAPNFNRELIIGIALPPTHTPPKLSISKVFVQDSTLTVRYIRITDSTLLDTPQPVMSQPMLLLAVPKQAILKTRLVENGKVVQTIRKRDNGAD